MSFKSGIQKQVKPRTFTENPSWNKRNQTKSNCHSQSQWIDQAQLLEVKFPNLGIDDIIIPGMVNLSFNIELTSTADPKRMLVSNIGRAIVKKLAIKFEGNEIMSADNFGILACYRDLWKTASEKKNAIRIENALEGITLQIEKKVETDGALNAFIYLIMDAQLNIQNGT